MNTALVVDGPAVGLLRTSQNETLQYVEPKTPVILASEDMSSTTELQYSYGTYYLQRVRVGTYVFKVWTTKPYRLRGNEYVEDAIITLIFSDPEKVRRVMEVDDLSTREVPTGKRLSPGQGD